ncbi:MAG: dehypoxanthine futalosine cyclase [candidate division KSB1 bacterium]|nr:dehypoxanthine futalosine cyclase [candidate division KSB1 bacterium]MDZ7368577.1 dehypoxanthine futalosine cyclase [candidate division KSB1 bacterium]MDZ7406386.1 dehypoxanthine futalosine cyclase [candidate division KSB1 bacterium]
MNINYICAKSRAGERLTREEGLALLREGELLELGAIAEEIRYRQNPNPWVTFVVDSNPNYTNICNVDCIFCAFYRHEEDSDAYTYSVDHMIQKFKESAQKGVTTVLLQGGVNPNLPFDYYLELVRRTRAEVPEIHPHFFSTSEILGMATVSGLSVREVLRQLKEAGLNTIPGGGAEILSDRVKKKISHKKGTSADWLEVMREAHHLGYKTTATMMYGHLETDEDIVEHLDSLRALQDETGGFTAFIPWSFKPGNTPLEKIIPTFAPPTRYLQILAFSRIYLDNFPHIQASWFSEGKKIGQVALHFGADDFGGTLVEENVHAAANFVNKTSTDEVIMLIRESGFVPAQRTTLYEILKVYEA